MSAAAERADGEVAARFALKLFLDALAAGELQTAAACLSREACFLTADGTAVHGREQIAPLLAQMIDAETEVELTSVGSYRAGDTALVTGAWVLRSRATEGARIAHHATPTVVLRQIEQRWKIALVSLWGSP